MEHMTLEHDAADETMGSTRLTGIPEQAVSADGTSAPDSATPATHVSSTPSAPTSTTASPLTDDEARIAAATKRYLEISENRLSAQTDWYTGLAPSDKTLLHAVCETAVSGFIEWAKSYRSPRDYAPVSTDHIFFVAPVEFMRSIKLSQTLDATRIIVDVIVDNLDLLASSAASQQSLLNAALIYSRSVAFSAAEVYANAAEVHGTWDARDEAFIIESLIAGETGTALQARMASFHWTSQTHSLAFVGKPDSAGELRAGMKQDRLRRHVSAMGGFVCMSQHQDLLVALFGSPTEGIPDADPDHAAAFAQALANEAARSKDASGTPADYNDAHGDAHGTASPSVGAAAARAHASSRSLDSLLGDVQASPDERISVDSLTRLVMPLFDAGSAVCMGPVCQGFDGASYTVRAALGGYHASAAIANCPRPFASNDVLPERALFGDRDARNEMYGNIYQMLKDANSKNSVLATVTAYLFSGGSLDKTAQQLSVHPNTVRYRLRRSVDMTGWDPTDPREAYVLLTALKVGMIKDAHPEL